MSVHGGQVVVESRPLCWTGSVLALGAPRPETVSAAVPVAPGDIVSLHWDWVCDRLTPRQVAALARYTGSQLEVANHALAKPVADLVLG